MSEWASSRHHAFSFLVIFSCGLLRHLEHEEKRDEGAESLTSIDLVLFVNGYRHLLVVLHVIGWENSPHEVHAEIGGTGSAENLACGAEIVVDVAVVEHIHAADKHINVRSAFINKLSEWWSLALTFFFKAFVISSRVFALCSERVVHSLILRECLEAFRIFVSFLILGVEEHIFKELEGHKIANIDEKVTDSRDILDRLLSRGQTNNLKKMID